MELVGQGVTLIVNRCDAAKDTGFLGLSFLLFVYFVL